MHGHVRFTAKSELFSECDQRLEIVTFDGKCVKIPMTLKVECASATVSAS